ncbi:MAG TPA: hypothetical protein VFZ43_01445 [Anaerolineales bacterium]
MKTSAKYVSASLIFILILCVVIWILAVQTKFFGRAYDELILDNRNHYLSCEQLPPEAEVRNVIEAHQADIQKIEEINPGFVGVEIDASTCPGKADIIFWYGTHQDRLVIEDLIAGDTFYGVPYRLQNR